MPELFGFILFLFVLGLFFRKKGDNCADTIEAGCGGLIGITVILIIIYFCLKGC